MDIKIADCCMSYTLAIDIRLGDVVVSKENAGKQSPANSRSQREAIYVDRKVADSPVSRIDHQECCALPTSKPGVFFPIRLQPCLAGFVLVYGPGRVVVDSSLK